MLILDIQLLTVFLSAVSAMQTVVLWLYYLVTPRYAGVKLWAVAGALSTAGFVLLVLRDRIPDFLSIIVANGALLGATLLLHRGILRFAGYTRPLQEWLFLAFACATMLAFVPFTYILPDISSRTLLISCSIGAVHCMNSWNLFRMAPPDLELSFRYTAVVVGAYGLWLLLRGLLAVVVTPMQSLFQPTTLQTVHFLVVMVASTFWTAGLTGMCTQRLLRELHRAQAAEQAPLQQAT